MLAVLGGTAVFSYKAGEKQAAKTNKSALTSSLFNKDILKNLAKQSKNKPATSTSSNAFTNSSGFFRLSGTIQTVSKSSYVIKLSSGNLVTVTTKDTTTYYQGSAKLDAKSINKNTQIIVMGTIGSDGAFNVSAIHKIK